MNLEGRFVIAGTGAREFERLEEKTPILARLEKVLLLNREKRPNLTVMSGGAQGWDRHLALTAKKLEIPYVLCLPNPGYLAYYYERDSLIGFARPLAQAMLAGAEQVEYTSEVLRTNQLYVNGTHMNFHRNDRMVALADAFLVYDPSSAGTKQCLSRIQAAQKPYLVI